MPKTFIKITGERKDVVDKIAIIPQALFSVPQELNVTMTAIKKDLDRTHYISNELPTHTTSGVKNLQTQLSQERAANNLSYTQGDFTGRNLTKTIPSSKGILNSLKESSNTVAQDDLYALRHEFNFCYRDKDDNICGLSILSERNDIVEQVGEDYVIKDTPVETREILYTIVHISNVDSPQMHVTFYTESAMLAPDIQHSNLPNELRAQAKLELEHRERIKKASPAQVSDVPEEKVKEELSALINDDFVSKLINTQLFEGDEISLKGLTSLEARFKSTQDHNIDNRDIKSLQYLVLSDHINASTIYTPATKTAMSNFIQQKREEYAQDPQAYMNINYSRYLQNDKNDLLELCQSEEEKLDIQRSFLLLQAENITMLLEAINTKIPLELANNIQSTIAQIRDNKLTDLSSLKDLLKQAETLYTESLPKNPSAEKPASISSTSEPKPSSLGAVAATIGGIVIMLLVLFPQIGLIAALIASAVGAGAIIVANTRTSTSTDNISLSNLRANREPDRPATKLPYFEALDTAFKEVEHQELEIQRSEMQKTFAEVGEKQNNIDEIIDTVTAASPPPSSPLTPGSKSELENNKFNR